VKINFAPEAAKDLDEAVEWYEAERKGLGKRFAKTIEAVLRIARYPFFGTEVKTGIYRSLVKRYPYAEYYSIQADEIMIYAIAHLHRKTFYWSSRLG
jgi:plasmid stabilization system protein ParE